MGYVRLQREPFSADEVVAQLAGPSVGGVTTYVGTVRGDDGERRVKALQYDAYDEMAVAELERLRQDTIERFGLVDAIVIHRLGRLAPGEPILLVALAGRHRKETFGAIDHLMDRLKEVVPIWKKEETDAGPAWILGAAKTRVKP